MNTDRTSGVADVSGAQFGKYRIVRLLGDGTYGAVYEAFAPGAMGFAKKVAIKRLRPHLIAGDRRFLQSMVNEARIGALLQHANIVNILEFDQVEGHYYLAMEYVDGATLEEVIRVCQRRRVLLPRFAVVDLVVQVCRGLHHAHQMRDHDGLHLRLIHRDVKPSNIIVDRGGTARILDFGIAKAATNLFNNTAPGLTKGTPRYMSPEQLRGEYPLQPRSDVFSAGVVLYELITARPLFFGESLEALLHQVVSADIGERLDQAEAAFPGCRPILARALDRDGERRYPDARSLATDLRKLGQRYPSEVETADVVQALLPVIDRPQRRKIADASELDHHGGLPVADEFVDDEEFLGTAPIRPPPSDSSGWAEFTAALTAHHPVEFPDEERDAYTLSQSDLQTVAPPGAKAVTQLQPLQTTGEPGGSALVTPTAHQQATKPPVRRRHTWLYLLLAPAVVIAGFGLGIAVVAIWSSLQGSGTVADPAVGPPDPTDGASQEDPPAEPPADAVAGADTGQRGQEPGAEDATTALVEPPTPAHREEPEPPTAAPPEKESPTPDRGTSDDRSSSRDDDYAPGTLSLYVRQWSRIYVDGTLVGNETNSLARHAVEGGKHSIRVVCGAATCPCVGLEKRYRVRVDGNDVKLPHLDFEALSADCP